MDALDHLAPTAVDLLSRVDERLAGSGAPPDHPVWTLLGRLRVLPGAGMAWVAGLRPMPLTVAGRTLRGVLQEYADVHHLLTAVPAGGSGAGDDGWQGSTAELFAAHRAALVTHLAGPAESMTTRIEATAAYADAVADWIDNGRAALARTLADVLVSAEAVTVRAGTSTVPETERAMAAAEIGWRVLATVADVHDQGEVLLRRHRAGLAELTMPAPDGSVVRLDRITRLAY